MGTYVILVMFIIAGVVLYRVVKRRSGIVSVPSGRASELPAFNPDHWIGRKFRTDLSLEAALQTFDQVKHECYAISGREELDWLTPRDASTFRSTQGSPTDVPPAQLLSYRLVAGGRITLAVWNGMVTQGANGLDGPPIEMWFVPSEFDRSGIVPIAGLWKNKDSSITSIGWVESPLWGARQAF